MWLICGFIVARLTIMKNTFDSAYYKMMMY